MTMSSTFDNLPNNRKPGGSYFNNPITDQQGYQQTNNNNNNAYAAHPYRLPTGPNGYLAPTGPPPSNNSYPPQHAPPSRMGAAGGFSANGPQAFMQQQQQQHVPANTNAYHFSAGNGSHHGGMNAVPSGDHSPPQSLSDSHHHQTATAAAGYGNGQGRAMPSFAPSVTPIAVGGDFRQDNIRQRAAKDHSGYGQQRNGHSGTEGEDSSFAAVNKPGKVNAFSNPAAFFTSLMNPSKLSFRAQQLVLFVRTTPPAKLLRYVVGLVAALWLLRFLFLLVLDRSKYNSFTIVSIMKDMSDEAYATDRMSYVFQYAALKSWSALVPHKNIMTFVEHQDMCSPIQAVVPGSQCYPIPCWHSEFSKPLLNCVFEVAHAKSNTDIIAFVSPEMVLYSDLANSIELADKSKDKFVLVGKRTNTLLNPLMFESEEFRQEAFLTKLRDLAVRTGTLHTNYGIDLFVYRKKCMEQLKLSNAALNGEENADGEDEAEVDASSSNGFLPSSSVSNLKFPPFLAGVYPWDNWLLSQWILDDSVTVIDISSSVMLVHPEKGRVKHTNKVGATYNVHLAKTLVGSHYKIGTIDNAGAVLDDTCRSAFETPTSAGEGVTMVNKLVAASRQAESNSNAVVDPSAPPTATPASLCQVVANQNVTDVVLFTKKASKEGYLVVLTVNHNYINLALNWVCWADRIKFSNYILIAEDQSSAGVFKKRGVAVIVKRDAPWIKKAGDYGSVEFQETMTFRTEFLMSVLQAGFHFVTADMDGLWLDDPIPFFNNAADLQGQMHKVTKISGGLVIVRATTYGRYFWNMVITCQRGNAAFLDTATKMNLKYEPSKYTEQYCINELSRGLASQPLFSRSLLDPYVFPDGKSFFDEKNPQYRGIWPAIIHNNWILGTSNKIKRLHDWNLASAEEETQECAALDALPFPALSRVDTKFNKQMEQVVTAINTNTMAEAKKDGKKVTRAKLAKLDSPTVPWDNTDIPLPFDLKIRVFTSSNPDHLQKCLDSLAATDFEGDRPRIGLEISIDHPPAAPDEEEVRGWNRVNTIANNFQWNAGGGSSVGEKIIIEQPYTIGASGQFLRGWIPSSKSDDELMLYIDDSNVLSPHWYKWLKRVLLKYQIQKKNFDPRMMGISLNLQNLVLGETYINRYGGEDASNPRNPYDLLNKQTSVYKYQLFSAATTSILLFPQHWRSFLTWLDAHHVDTITGLGPASSTPCVPTLISNKWWSENSVKHWYQWLNRFNFEQGYYILYTNFPDRYALTIHSALLDPATEKKMIRMNPPKLLLNITAANAASTYLNIPTNSADIGVYDFQFNRVSTPDVLAWRKHQVSDRIMEQCWTMDQLAQKLRDDEAAEQAAIKAKEEAKAKEAAEKKAAAKAAKDKENKEKKAKEAKAKAEKDAAAKAKKDAAAKSKKDSKDAEAKDKKKSDNKKDLKDKADGAKGDKKDKDKKDKDKGKDKDKDKKKKEEEKKKKEDEKKKKEKKADE